MNNTKSIEFTQQQLKNALALYFQLDHKKIKSLDIYNSEGINNCINYSED